MNQFSSSTERRTFTIENEANRVFLKKERRIKMASRLNNSFSSQGSSYATAPSTPRKRPSIGTARRTLLALKPLIGGDWLKKNPPKEPIYVRIGGMVNPSKFWVREVPMNKDKRIEAKGVHKEIDSFEKGLGRKYNVPPKAEPDGQVKPAVDLLVAVRPGAEIRVIFSLQLGVDIYQISTYFRIHFL